MFKPFILFFIFTSASISSATASSDDIAKTLNERFNMQIHQSSDGNYRCNKSDIIFDCAGVLIRTNGDRNYSPWNVSPKAKQLQSISTSYIHNTIPTNKLYHPTGMTLYPYIEAFLYGSSTWYPRCFYPLDANTANVGTIESHGCKTSFGSINYDDLSSCEQAGVTTASEWATKYRNGSAPRSTWCSFNIITSSSIYSAMMAGRSSLINNPNLDYVWNEILINVWDDTYPNLLPIESFTYDKSAPGALEIAQTYQRRYCAQAQSPSAPPPPIVQIDLSLNKPNNNGDVEVFKYSANDQVLQNC